MMKKLSLNLAVLAFGLTFALLAAELMVRIGAPQLTYRFPRGLFTNDDAVAYRLTPGFEGRLKTPEYRTDVHVNAQGLRDDAVPEVKRDDEFRVLMLGDSFVMGVGVEAEETFVERLEDVIDERIADRDVEIINAGVAGYSTHQAVEFLLAYGAELQPDLIVLGFFVGNDLAENASDPLGVRDGYLSDDKNHGGVLPYSLRRFVSLNSQLYHLLWPLQRRIRGYGGEAQDGARGIAEIFLTDDDAATPRWAPTAHALKRFVAAARGLDVPTAVILIPDHTQVDPFYWNALIGQAGAEQSAYADDAPNRRLLELLQTEGVPTLDLLPAFKAQPDPAGLYLPLDKHWTVPGHVVATEASVSFVERLVLDPSRVASAPAADDNGNRNR